jgi:hypothetical protein
MTLFRWCQRVLTAVLSVTSPPPPGDLQGIRFTLGRAVTPKEVRLLTQKLSELANTTNRLAFVDWFLHHFYPGDQSHIAFKVEVARTVDVMCRKIIRNCQASVSFYLIITFDRTAYRFTFSRCTAAPTPSCYHVSLQRRL